MLAAAQGTRDEALLLLTADLECEAHVGRTVTGEWLTRQLARCRNPKPAACHDVDAGPAEPVRSVREGQVYRDPAAAVAGGGGGGAAAVAMGGVQPALSAARGGCKTAVLVVALDLHVLGD